MKNITFKSLLAGLMGICVTASAQISGNRTLTAEDLVQNGKEVVIKTASFKVDKWVRIGENRAQDKLTADEVLIVEVVDTKEKTFRLRSKVQNKYIKSPQKDWEITELGTLKEAAVFTAGVVGKGPQSGDITVPIDVDKETKAFRLTAKYPTGQSSHLNTQNGTKLLWHVATGPNSYVLVYDVTGYKNRTVEFVDEEGKALREPMVNVFAGEGFQIDSIPGYKYKSCHLSDNRMLMVYERFIEKNYSYKLSFSPLKSIDELEDNVSYVIRNCFNHGVLGNRSGYVKMENPILKVKSVSQIDETCLFKIRRIGDKVSFKNGDFFIPSDGAMGGDLSPAGTEKLFSVIPVCGKAGVFNFKSTTQNAFLNANAGTLTFWNKNPHPYQIYKVERIDEAPLENVTLKFMDQVTGKVLSSAKISLAKGTFPAWQDLGDLTPNGTSIAAIDDVPLEKIKELDPVSEEKKEYVIKTKYCVQMNTTGYATMYANCALCIPEGLEAYIGNFDDSVQYLELTALKNVIPANTAVILRCHEVLEKEKEYVFEMSEESGSMEGYTNILKGSEREVLLPLKLRKFYTLQLRNGILGFYQYEKMNALEEYLSPFTVYLDLDENFTSKVCGMRIIDDKVTAIELVNKNTRSPQVIFDLEGRQIHQILQPGIYLVNGKKVFIK